MGQKPRRSFEAFWAALALIFAALLVAFPQTGYAGIKSGLRLCYDIIIPSLFPFMFAADYIFSFLTSRGGASQRLLLPLSFLFSSIGGFPMGAGLLAELAEQKKSAKASPRCFCAAS